MANLCLESVVIHNLLVDLCNSGAQNHAFSLVVTCFSIAWSAGITRSILFDFRVPISDATNFGDNF